MLTDQEFVRRWSRVDDPLVRFAPEAVSPLHLQEEDRHFLTTAGLPASCAPFLHTRVPTSAGPLPTVAESWRLPPHLFTRYRDLGSTGSGDPLALDEEASGTVVLLNHDRAFERVLVNSAVRQYAASLLAYREMFEAAIAAGGEDAFLDNKIPAECRAKLERELRRIDPPALGPSCFWSQELARLSPPEEPSTPAANPPCPPPLRWLRRVSALLHRNR